MEQQLMMAARLYGARKAAKFLLGDKFAEHMAAYGRMLLAKADVANQDVLVAAIQLAKQATQPHEAVYILAAAVEIIEPTTPNAEFTERRQASGGMPGSAPTED